MDFKPLRLRNLKGFLRSKISLKKFGFPCGNADILRMFKRAISSPPSFIGAGSQQ